MRNEPWPRGCLQVYTGDGKGKTTAAFGLALRAAGRGLPVFVGQFMKKFPYGELEGAARLGGLVAVEQFGSDACIPWRDEPDAADVARAETGLARCIEVLGRGRHAIVVLDEVTCALHYRLVTLEALLRAVDARPERVELVCTGRFAPPELMEKADLVTEMREVKHPFSAQGLTARDGIER